MKTDDTKQKIQAGFFTLSQTIPLKKITVSRLCEACKISRSTFYLHYDNVEDLTDSLEKELLYTLEKLFRQEQTIPFTQMDNKTFLQILSYIENNRIHFLFFQQQSGSLFSEKLMQVIEQSLQNRLQIFGIVLPPVLSSITFAVAGILQFLTLQITDNLPHLPETICNTYNSLLLRIFLQTQTDNA